MQRRCRGANQQRMGGSRAACRTWLVRSTPASVPKPTMVNTTIETLSPIFTISACAAAAAAAAHVLPARALSAASYRLHRPDLVQTWVSDNRGGVAFSSGWQYPCYCPACCSLTLSVARS